MGGRVREARVAAGLSQDALGRRLGLGRTVVAKIESGNREIDALELAKLADVLGLPLRHFLTRPPAVLSRRAELAEDTASQIDEQSYRMEAALQAWLTDIRQLVESRVLEVPTHRLYPGSLEDHESARQAARWVRDALDIGSNPIDTMMWVCQSMGQLVSVVEIPGDGASLIEGEIAAAVVSRTGDPGRRRTTAAHELGHFVLGDEYSTDLGVHSSRDEREKIINSFAAELLLPVSVIRERAVDGPCSRQTLVKLAAEYRTSWSLAVGQAVRAGLANPGMNRETPPTKAELQEAVGWAPQPDLESIGVPPMFADAVLSAWRASLITGARAEEMMRGELSASDLPAREESELEP